LEGNAALKLGVHAHFFYCTCTFGQQNREFDTAENSPTMREGVHPAREPQHQSNLARPKIRSRVMCVGASLFRYLGEGVTRRKMAGGLPGSRAFIPSSPFGTATPFTITQPGGAVTALRTDVSPLERASFSGTVPAGGTETKVQICFDREPGGERYPWLVQEERGSKGQTTCTRYILERHRLQSDQRALVSNEWYTSDITIRSSRRVLPPLPSPPHLYLVLPFHFWLVTI